MNLVFTFYARAPFAEILTMMFLFAGFWAMWTAWSSDSARGAFLGGLFFGASFLVRLDALVFMIPMVAYLAYEQRRVGGRPAAVRGFWRGMLPMLLLAIVDLVLITPDYIANHAPLVLPMFAAVVVVIVVDGMLGRQVGAVIRRIPPVKRARIAAAGAWLVVLGMFGLYIVRPLVQEVAGSPYLTLVMSDEELAAGQSRNFSEQSARWLGWYLGPLTVLFGSLGWAMLTRRVLMGARRLAIPFFLSFSALAVAYLWRPLVNPDQIWAMRRFLPIVIPGFVILAALLLDELRDVSARWKRPGAARGGVSVAAAAVVVGSLVPFAPLADLHEFSGLTADVERSCDVMGEHAVVLFVDPTLGSAGGRLGATYRGFCGIPAATTANDDPAFLSELAVSWAAEGRELWLLSVDFGLLEGLGVQPIVGVIVGDYEILELTFTRRPTELAEFKIAVYGAPASTLTE